MQSSQIMSTTMSRCQPVSPSLSPISSKVDTRIFVGQWARTGNRKLRKNFRINRYYYGDWGGGTPQGRGILYEPGKILIDANFSSGVPGSPAKIIFINKNSEYEGELEGGKINGKGTMINHAEMYSFSGEWKDSEPQKGSLILTKDKNI